MRERLLGEKWFSRWCHQKIRGVTRKKQNGMVLLGTTPQRKLTLPDDANRVVQTKKETNPKPNE